MRRFLRSFSTGSVVACGVLACVLSGGAQARDAAFIEPSALVGAANVGDAVRVEPKSEIDVGDSPLNVGRRTTLFFANQSGAPVKIEKVAAQGDGNVNAELANDDCSKQGSLAPGNRCSVDVVATPTAAGSWHIEVLMTHDGAGRLARARVAGKTAGGLGADKKDSGLFLNTRDVKPVDFGEVAVGEDKVVRSALMVNDSPLPITLYAIDVIEAANGLQRLDRGCAVDMELKAGESCPVILMWSPSERGRISTDLVIRHSGQAGFVVVPVRGLAKGGEGVSSQGGGWTKATESSGAGSVVAPPPLDAALSQASKHAVGSVSESALRPSTTASAAAKTKSSADDIHLIGTVGTRALLFGADETTSVVQAGDSVTLGNTDVKVIAVNAKSVDVIMGGKKRSLSLTAMPLLVEKAKTARKDSGTGARAPLAEASGAEASGAEAGANPLAALGVK